MSRPLVVGNWKMHGSHRMVVDLLGTISVGAKALPGVGVAVCPPFPYLQQAAAALAGGPVMLGGQNLAVENSGAFTGEVSGPMLRDVGCRYVIVGHSERRTLFGEDDALVARKFRAAEASGLIPILCVGEQLGQRQAGETEQVIAAQLDAVLELCGPQALAAAVIAYEPVWAIGTGQVATPDQAQVVHRFIRERVSRGTATPTLLYGGSVKADNAAGLFAQADVDGGLIGGASLVADQFLSICKAAIPR
jgi:triosephosphate isomerase (TIM)